MGSGSPAQAKYQRFSDQMGILKWIELTPSPDTSGVAMEQPD
jgi:hypothetical protein